MSSRRLLPHLSVASDSITWGTWWVEMDGFRSEVEERLKGWDYASEVTFEVQPSIDVKRALRSSGIADASEVGVVALAECRATGLRLRVQKTLADLSHGQSNILSLSPEPGSLADTVHLSAHLVYLGVGVPNEEGRAWRPGSRLATSPTTSLRLEGEDPRFPTEAVSFRALRLDDAAWTLQMNFSDLDESFMGSIRLLLNTDHPAAEQILACASEETGLLRGTLMMDVVRQLMLRIAADENAEEMTTNWPEGSVGMVVESMAREMLASDLSSICHLIRSDYPRFERKLQSGLGFLQGEAS